MTTETTNPVGDEPMAEAPEVEETEGQEVEAQELDDEGNPVEPEPEDDETEEFDLNGKKIRIQKDLKPLLLMQADYTRKTQEVAESRKALEARQAEISQQAETVQALRVDYGRVEALKGQIEQYSNIDWPAWSAQDPTAAQAGWFQFQQIKDAHDTASKDLTEKEQALLQKSRETVANFQKQVGNELADPVKGIPGWGVERATKIVEYATRELGLTQDELVQSDARAWKAIHRLETVEAELAALKAKQTKAQHHEKAQQAQPAVRPKGNFAPAGLHDNLSPEEWVRRRNAQLAKRG